jgi:CubicO group peptidase (beta-lactamase class C family)
MDGAALAAFDAEIAAGRYGLVSGLLVIRRGQVVLDRSYRHNYDSIYGPSARVPSALNSLDPSGQYNYYNPWWHPTYRRGELHSLQSVTKTITSVIIGTAVARGEFPPLDTPVLAFFDTTRVAHLDDRKRRLTIRHLLTMTAGLDWNEDLPYTDPRNSCVIMEASFDWVRYVINLPMAQEPGTGFAYNSGATQLLSHIFRVATGRDIEEYAAQSLFAPLGIRAWFWKRTPTGLPDTEGGLYLSRQDLARIAYLFLRGGAWNDQTIVTPEWIRESVSPRVAVGAALKYGYKWWLVPYGASDPRLVWAGSGFGGQFPLVFPDHDVVVVATGWNIEPGGQALSWRVLIDRILAAMPEYRREPRRP